MKSTFTILQIPSKVTRVCMAAVLLLCLHQVATAQLGIYQFTGSGSCPTQNPVVTTQPANAVFSNFTNVNASCNSSDNVCKYKDWNTTTTISLDEYHQFSITANAGYLLSLTSLSFSQVVKDLPSSGLTTWELRSNLDNYSSSVASGISTTITQVPVVALSPLNFTNIPNVTFRFYLTNAKGNGTTWTIDDVSILGSVNSTAILPGTPTSNSPQCSTPGVTMAFTGTAPAGETWYWQSSQVGTSTAVSTPTYIVNTPGLYYVRSRNNSSLLWGVASLPVNVSIVTMVSAPVFSMGMSSQRCQSAETITYNAYASGATEIKYYLDNTTLAAGNTIDSLTGTVTYQPGWTGSTTITANAYGCGPVTSSQHAVTTNLSLGTTSFLMGATSIRCQGADLVTYEATADNAASMIYQLDAASLVGGNSINAATGDVNFVSTWSGTSLITAIAGGCNGPVTAIHTVTVTPVVGTPVFAAGTNSVVCQGNSTATYTATSSNATGIIYTLDAASLAAGNTINSSTGKVSFVAGWSGITSITATADGCDGPKSAVHTVNVSSTVGIPVFALGIESVRTQAAGTVNYTATAISSASITYTLDPSSISGGNSINAATGAVSWSANWFGVSLITANATGCNGPTSSTHIVNSNSNVAQTPLYLSIPSQAMDRIDPVAAGIAIATQSAELSSTATTNTTFTQAPVLCNPLTIKAQTLSVVLFVTITNGTMPASPSVTAQLKYGGTNIISFTNPVYNTSAGTMTWTAVLGADVTIPTGQAIALKITTAQANVKFKIDYHSATKNSRISLLPVSTFINFNSFDIYSQPYPGGTIRTNSANNTMVYARAVVSTPFGYADITGLTMKITPPASLITAVCVDSTSCTRTYEYAWLTPNATGTYSFIAKARQGYENNIFSSAAINFDVCSSCGPTAVNDSAIGNGGAPLIVDVLANDYDPNNNIKVSSLSVVTQPFNGAAFISNGKLVYLPNGSFAGNDTITYKICDSTNFCATAKVFYTINPLIIDVCSETTKSHTYFIPYPEDDAFIALKASSNTSMPSNNIRTVISLTIPYPGMIITWDQWEDGYELNPLDPQQSTTQVWGDGNPYNGIAPGYANDIIPAGGSIVLDNTMPANPRVKANIFYDGKDKITTSGQIAMTQVCGEPTRMPVQAIKTNITSTENFGQSFTIPLGQNYPSKDFAYTALFIRAAEDSTNIQIDKDNDGIFETTKRLNQGESFLLNGGVYYGATVASDKPVGVELNAGGIDQYSIRNAPIYPATWYSHTYYTPVPTSDNAGDSPKDTSVVMLYNSLNRPLTINWYSGAPANGTISLPSKTAVRFPLAYSTTNAYKFVNPTGESFTAIEIVDSYTPYTGAQDGSTYDWSFNLIAEDRLTDYATTAWAPGGLDLVAPPGPDVNGNPIWVTPNVNTTIYVKYDGDISGSSGQTSPCGLKYDVSYALNALKYIKLRDLADNDMSGMAVYTCNGAKIAAVYGEDPMGSTTGIGIAYWDVGTTIQPACKQKLLFANDDYARTLINQPVTIPILLNDFGFLAIVDPATVNLAGMLQAKNGTVTVNANGTVLYTPNPGFVGKDTFEYNVCSTPSQIVCDYATVYVQISICPAPFNENVIVGRVFLDKNKDGINNDGGTGITGSKVYLYVDGNCNAAIDANELKDSVTVDASGTYQFITYPEKFVADDFQDSTGAKTCANGSDGNAAWLSDWVDAGDNSVGFCNNTQSAANTDCDIFKDGAYSYALRLKDKNVSATRTVNLNGASYAFLTFSYRRKSTTMTAGRNVIVQASKNGSTFGTVFTIAGDGTTDAGYVTIYNQDITAYTGPITYIRFLTNNNMGDADTVYIDNVKIQFTRYPQCYITKLLPASIPANYYATTPTQYAFTTTSSTTCLSPYDFGIAKNSIAISGTLLNDANGLTDNLVNGNAIGMISGSPVYGYLIDSLGKVAFKILVNTAVGNYIFPTADILTTYKVALSTVNVNIGANAPQSAGLPWSWVCTGDAFGVNNMGGSGIKPGFANTSITVKTNLINVTDVNFGIERVPESDDKTAAYSLNTPGMLYDVPALSGSDPEDGLLGAGKTYKITSLPAGAILYYNFVPVVVNQVIPAFNPTFLKIDPDDATFSTLFNYASMDTANMFDPTPATIRVNWSSILPITLMDFSGKLNGTKVDLFWNTSSENNGDYFDVERSLNGQDFRYFTKVNAVGFSNTESNYNAIDPTPEKGRNYYRLRMVDKDATFVYSKVITIRNDNEASLDTRVMPNPFTGKLDVYLTLTKNSDVQLKFIDITGKTVYLKTVKGLKGFNWFVVNDLEKLPATPYILYVITDEKTFTEKLIKQ